MDKKSSSDLFVNDGSFMERFKQLHQDNQNQKISTKDQPKSVASSTSISMKINTSSPLFGKRQTDVKSDNTKKNSAPTSGGKLAFSLKQKSKISVAPVKLGADEDEPEEDAENFTGDVPIKRQKLSGPGDVGNASCVHLRFLLVSCQSVFIFLLFFI